MADLSAKKGPKGNGHRIGTAVEDRATSDAGRDAAKLGGTRAKTSLKGTFRLAQVLGLFPVSGLPENSSVPLQFRPWSLRLFATLIVLFVIIIIEGIGLLRVFFWKEQGNMILSPDGFNVKYRGSNLSEMAPLVHYGTTVMGMVYLLVLARRFPTIANRWQLNEEKSEVMGTRRKGRRFNDSTCRTAMVIAVLTVASLWQAVFGTLISHFIKSPVEILGTPAQTQQLPNSTVIGFLEENFFSQYAINSHNFIVTLMDESFLVGVLTFLVSNYTIFVWIIVDLTLILSTRSIHKMVLNDILSSSIPTSNADFERIRQRHHTVCILVKQLNEAGFAMIFLSFYFGNLYFMWIHLSTLFGVLIALQAAYATNKTTIFVLYQLWAFLRQIIRFSLVSYSAVKLAEGLKQRTLEKFILGFPSSYGSSVDIRLSGSTEARQALKAQCTSRHSGYSIGCLFPLKRRTLTFLVLGLATSLFWTLQLEANAVPNPALKQVGGRDHFRPSDHAWTTKVAETAGGPEGGGGGGGIFLVNEPAKVTPKKLNIVMW